MFDEHRTKILFKFVSQPAKIKRQLLAHLSHQPDGCLLWTSRTKSKYGYIHLEREGRGSDFQDHRIIYLLYGGPIPEGFQLDHLCRKPRCCNPNHLEPVPGGVNLMRAVWAKLFPDDYVAWATARMATPRKDRIPWDRDKAFTQPIK